jgi:hypothetical protein
MTHGVAHWLRIMWPVKLGMGRKREVLGTTVGIRYRMFGRRDFGGDPDVATNSIECLGGA